MAQTDYWIKYWNHLSFHPESCPLRIGGIWWELWETEDGMFFLKTPGIKPLLLGDSVQVDELINIIFGKPMANKLLGEPTTPNAVCAEGVVPQNLYSQTDKQL